ncbi:GNAT family N-acetyltransferase [Sphingomonas sp. M1-B02]|uniref:GNAT family N-acetyltransferase n=1 Tax=Sphingomonas sp. M1-B02 TaxID=3114300 RepID=UPI00224027D2|nr:GNAT family protein [Sphingomonas sp. S6-11]UZK65016.1 GNAT family N-acetyltransferase [Sphingomonas sp. S6-11]
MIQLHAMTDRDFAWLLGEAESDDSLRLCEGGIGPHEVTAMLRGISAEIAAGTDQPVAWLIVQDGHVVGMTSFTRARGDGGYDIGYGMAPTFEGRGIMSAALAELVRMAPGLGHKRLTAETSVDNPGSQRVLEKNGFMPVGTRDDPEDGALIQWAIELPQTKSDA